MVPGRTFEYMIKPLHIGLVAQGGRNWMGGLEYIRNIIIALNGLSEEVKKTYSVSLLADSQTEVSFIQDIQPYVKQIIFIDRELSQTIVRQVFLAIQSRIFNRLVYRYDKLIKRYDIDFVYPVMSLNSGFNVKNGASWIYDFQHKYFADYFTSQEITNRDREFYRLAEKAPVIVLSSKTAEKDFKQFYPESTSLTCVLPFKILFQSHWTKADPMEIQKKYYLPDKFLIVCNQFWQHKNHLAVFNALKLLSDKGIHPVVVFTGHIDDYRKPEYSDLILQSIHTFGLSKQVFLLGLIPKGDQVQLLRRSIALIQPSLFEGWSTVVEDARSLGKPLILSDIPVHREQNPPNTRFFEPGSFGSLADAIADYWNELPPGPDLEQEGIARDKNRNEVVEFAELFLNIAQTGRV
jgi:glycosyltransferase involved in cell wall biosynthesis